MMPRSNRTATDAFREHCVNGCEASAGPACGNQLPLLAGTPGQVRVTSGVGEVRDLGGELLERLGQETVVGVAAVLLGLDQAGFAERAEMVRDVGLAGTGLVHEVAVAQLLAGKKLDDAPAERVREDAKGITLH